VLNYISIIHVLDANQSVNVVPLLSAYIVLASSGFKTKVVTPFTATVVAGMINENRCPCQLPDPPGFVYKLTNNLERPFG